MYILVAMPFEISKDTALTVIAMFVVATVCGLYLLHGVDVAVPEALMWLLTTLIGWLLGVGGAEKIASIVRTP